MNTFADVLNLVVGLYLIYDVGSHMITGRKKQFRSVEGLIFWLACSAVATLVTSYWMFTETGFAFFCYLVATVAWLATLTFESVRHQVTVQV